MVRAVKIRAFTDGDWPTLWPILHEVVTSGETFTYDPDMTESRARALWIEPPPGNIIVATTAGRVIGSAKMGANRPGPGSHVATASFIVASDARGYGAGSALCRFALDWARREGFAGMQFNAVAATNHAAIHVYERLGFSIVGTVPGAFAHPAFGRVGLHVMYREL